MLRTVMENGFGSFGAPQSALKLSQHSNHSMIGYDKLLHRGILSDMFKKAVVADGKVRIGEKERREGEGMKGMGLCVARSAYSLIGQSSA